MSTPLPSISNQSVELVLGQLLRSHERITAEVSEVTSLEVLINLSTSNLGVEVRDTGAIVTGDHFLSEEFVNELRTYGASVRFKPLFMADLLELVEGLRHGGARSTP